MCSSDNVIICIKWGFDIFRTKHQIDFQTLTTLFSILLKNIFFFEQLNILSLETSYNVNVYV